MKRAFDLLVASLALVALSPLMLLISVAVRARLGSPVLFRQERPGLDGQIFRLYKFRTMTDQRDEQGELAPDGERLTRFGRFLRSTSLDELPELFNVLRGEMSLVGPRPLRVEYLDRYDSFQSRRHEVRPGITGWAQVNGRNLLSWDERFRLDVWYVDNQTLLLDLRIMLLTVLAVFSRTGISSEDHDTMSEFLGSESIGGKSNGRPEEDSEASQENALSG